MSYFHNNSLQLQLTVNYVNRIIDINQLIVNYRFMDDSKETATTPDPKSKQEHFPFISRLFKGRINRSSFWIGQVILFIYFTLTSHLAILGVTPIYNLIYVLIEIFFIFFLVLCASLIIRRLHDLNNSGLYILILILPVVFVLIGIFSYYSHPYDSKSQTVAELIFLHPLAIVTYYLIPFLFLIYLSFWPGTKGKNKYGEQPGKQNLKKIFGLS